VRQAMALSAMRVEQGGGGAGHCRSSGAVVTKTVEDSVNCMLWEETYRRLTDLRSAAKRAVEESASKLEARDQFDQSAEMQATSRCPMAAPLPSVLRTEPTAATAQERTGRSESAIEKMASAAVAKAELQQTVVERLNLYGVAAILGERERLIYRGEQQSVGGSGGNGRGTVREVQVRWCRNDSVSEITWERKDMVVVFEDYLDAAVAVIKAALCNSEGGGILNENHCKSSSSSLSSSSSGDDDRAAPDPAILEQTYDGASTTEWQQLSLLVKRCPQETAGAGDCRSSSALSTSSKPCSSTAPSTLHSSGSLGLEIVAVDVGSSLYNNCPPPRPPSQQAAYGGGAIVGNSSIVSSGLLFNTTVLTVRAGSPAEAAGFIPGDIICDMNDVAVRPVANIDAAVDVFASLKWPSRQATFRCTILRPPVPLKDYYVTLLRNRRVQGACTSRSSSTNQNRYGIVDTFDDGSHGDVSC